MKKHYREENNCLNCGAELQGHFCHVCGQENLQIKESFGAMMGHAIGDYFHFDHQFFHTLKPLLFKPGFLTTEYLAGRRVQYLHPVKMYIFISVVFFLLYFRDSNNKVVEVHQTPSKQENVNVADSVKKAITADKNLSSAQKQKLVDKVTKHAANVGIHVNRKADTTHYNVFSITKNDDSTYTAYVAHQKKLPPEDQDSFFEKAWMKKKYDYNAKYGSRAQEVYGDEFKHNVPKMMFVLLPIFALILQVTFWRNKKFYIEHLIYSFHLHCFLFLYIAIIMLVESAFPVKWLTELLNSVSFFIVMWYVYRSLRVIYQRSRFRTITKIIGMYIMYFLSLIICISVVALITALTAA